MNDHDPCALHDDVGRQRLPPMPAIPEVDQEVDVDDVGDCDATGSPGALVLGTLPVALPVPGLGHGLQPTESQAALSLAVGLSGLLLRVPAALTACPIGSSCSHAMREDGRTRTHYHCQHPECLKHPAWVGDRLARAEAHIEMLHPGPMAGAALTAGLGKVTVLPVVTSGLRKQWQFMSMSRISC